MRLLTLTALYVLVLAPASWSGQLCGDDVDGRGTLVPCACGDVLVSSRTLDARDPITRGPCPTTGLLVNVPADRPAPTLGLGGHTITGSGRGIGIHVVSGGGDGLALVGPGTVHGFDVGVFAAGPALARATELTSSGNAADGFRVSGSGYSIAGCDALDNGRDGFALRGVGFHVEGNRAAGNGRSGFSLSGHDAALGGATGNAAEGNGRDGLAVRGQGHEVSGAVASGNGGRGLRARVSQGRIAGTLAHGNGRAGLDAAGGDLEVTDNEATDNHGDGIDVRGAAVRDGGGNRAHGNLRRRHTDDGECRVGSPCR